MKHYCIIFSVLLALLSWPLDVRASSVPQGDVNGDGNVTIADATMLIDYLLGANIGINAIVADVNQDGSLSIADVTMIIDYLLGGIEFPPVGEDPVETFTVNGVTFVMVRVEGGTFTMGATPEQGSDPSSREKPAHEVTVSSYSIGQTEVTQELWQAVMGNNPSYFIGYQHPVERVSWEDCQMFITTLNQLTERAFRLPTEAEWEFAARGGNMGMGYKYAGSDDLATVGWYSYNDSWELRGSGEHGTHTVATRMPNELDLFDMSGNVHEWVQDWYGGYSSGAQTNPTGPVTGSERVYRGGNWYFDEWFCRVSFRNSVIPSYTSHGIGLRLALSD
jgi:formylglycine-generating enzyme required for sulfatase activity